LNLDRTAVIAGLPIKIVRDAIREMNRHDVNDHGWTVDSLAAYLNVSATHAEWLCELLSAQGVLERKPRPDTCWHARGTYYAVSKAGTRFINATLLKRIDRAKADEIIAELLERVKKINADDELCHFINEIRLFGSAMDRNAASFGDIDICYVMARRKSPSQYKEWTDWNIARAKASGRRNLMFIDELYFGSVEVMRMLKNRSPYISLHGPQDVIAIGADSVRLFIAPEGAIETDDGGVSGEALSRAIMNAATEGARKKAKDETDKKRARSTASIADHESAKERMVSAVKSLAFDILRALDETTPLEAIEHSIEIAHERITAYRKASELAGVAELLRDALAVDVLERTRAAENETFVFSGDRERRAQDGTDDKAAAERGMKHAVIAELKCALTGRRDADGAGGMTAHFEAYRRADYDAWKYRQEHGYDWHGPEHLSGRAVITLRRIANHTGEKLDKQALKTLSSHGFIKPFRKTRWRLTAKGEVAIKYHDERDAWTSARNEKKLASLLAEKPELTRAQGREMIMRGSV
jgi:hypothetical protein